MVQSCVESGKRYLLSNGPRNPLLAKTAPRCSCQWLVASGRADPEVSDEAHRATGFTNEQHSAAVLARPRGFCSRTTAATYVSVAPAGRPHVAAVTQIADCRAHAMGARSMSVHMQAAEPGLSSDSRGARTDPALPAVGSLPRPASGVAGERHSDRECPNGDNWLSTSLHRLGWIAGRRSQAA
jgi:hypothetical protein